MHGGSGRVDGGIGIALDEPSILLEAELSPVLQVSGGDAATRERVGQLAAGVLQKIGAGGSVAITVRSSYPAHVGLGRGSQLSLAVARAISELHGRHLPVRELARLVGRGGTSGIGTAAFEYGGFIIDGGHRFGEGGEKTDFRPSSASRDVSPPPVISRKTGASCLPSPICHRVQAEVPRPRFSGTTARSRSPRYGSSATKS